MTEEILFSEKFNCPHCGFSVPTLEPRLFSFNAPLGACDTCKGLGITQRVNLNYLMPDKTKTIREGGILFWEK